MRWKSVRAQQEQVHKSSSEPSKFWRAFPSVNVADFEVDFRNLACFGRYTFLGRNSFPKLGQWTTPAQIAPNRFQQGDKFELEESI